MVKKVFYNSSLPRSGSTLIQNILAQNPKIYSSPTSGLFGFIDAARTIYSSTPEFKAQDEQEMEKAYKGFLKAGIYGYYNAITDRPYVIDKCRAWKSESEFINFFDPKPKIICMIRDLRGVFASVEKKYRQNPQLNLGTADWGVLRGTNSNKRLEHFSNTPPIGPAVDRLYDSILMGTHENVLFVRYEDLTQNPTKELKRIYSYLELPYFEHDFNNVEQITQEDDTIHGVFGDHIIRKKVEYKEPDFREVLGEKGCDMIIEAYPWFYELFEYEK